MARTTSKSLTELFEFFKVADGPATKVGDIIKYCHLFQMTENELFRFMTSSEWNERGTRVPAVLGTKNIPEIEERCFQKQWFQHLIKKFAEHHSLRITEYYAPQPKFLPVSVIPENNHRGNRQRALCQKVGSIELTKYDIVVVSSHSGNNMIYSGNLPYNELSIITEIARHTSNYATFPSNVYDPERIFRVIGGNFQLPEMEEHYFNSLNLPMDVMSSFKEHGLALTDMEATDAKQLCDNIIRTIFNDVMYEPRFSLDCEAVSRVMDMIGQRHHMWNYIHDKMDEGISVSSNKILTAIQFYRCGFAVTSGKVTQHIIRVIQETSERTIPSKLDEHFLNLLRCILMKFRSDIPLRYAISRLAVDKILCSLVVQGLRGYILCSSYNVEWFVKNFRTRMSEEEVMVSKIIKTLNKEYSRGPFSTGRSDAVLTSLSQMFPSLSSNDEFIRICDEHTQELAIANSKRFLERRQSPCVSQQEVESVEEVDRVVKDSEPCRVVAGSEPCRVVKDSEPCRLRYSRKDIELLIAQVIGCLVALTTASALSPGVERDEEFVTELCERVKVGISEWPPYQTRQSEENSTV